MQGPRSTSPTKKKKKKKGFKTKNGRGKPRYIEIRVCQKTSIKGTSCHSAHHVIIYESCHYLKLL